LGLPILFRNGPRGIIVPVQVGHPQTADGGSIVLLFLPLAHPDANQCSLTKMTTGRKLVAFAVLMLGLPLLGEQKAHVVTLGHFRTVPYTAAAPLSGASISETELKVRALLVDGQIREWTSGSLHNVTDRSFVIRRAMRINDALPAEKADHWVWQQGPWLLVDRISGHISVLHLPDYDPAISEIVWFRDYAAYCGVPTNGKHLEAVVAQIAGRRPILMKELKVWSPEFYSQGACASAVWQRTPLRVTFYPIGTAEISFDLVGNSAVLLEEGDEDGAQKAQ
jgi:hypothetical protein